MRYRPSREKGSDQLILTLYTLSIYPTVHNQLIRTLRGTHCTYIFNFFELIFFIFHAIFEFTKKYSKIKIATGLEKS